jgi:adenylate cyclase
MTRKDYKLIADTFKRHLQTGELESFKNENFSENFRRLVISLAKDLQEENIRFDLVKFCHACGL